MTDGWFQGEIEMGCYDGWEMGEPYVCFSLTGSVFCRLPMSLADHRLFQKLRLCLGCLCPPKVQTQGFSSEAEGQKEEIIHLWTMSHGGHYCAWVRCGLQLQMGMLSRSTLSQKRTPAKSDGECGFFETTSHCNYPRAYPLKRSFGKMIYIAKNPFVKWIQVCSPLSKSNLQIQFNSTNVYWLLFLYAGHHASASDKKDI